MKKLLAILTAIQWCVGIAARLLCCSDNETATLLEFFLGKVLGIICLLICIGINKLNGIGEKNNNGHMQYL